MIPFIQKYIDIIVAILIFFAGVGLLLFVGYMIGYSRGYDQSTKDTFKFTCLAQNKNKPLNEVEAQCVQFFTHQ